MESITFVPRMPDVGRAENLDKPRFPRIMFENFWQKWQTLQDDKEKQDLLNTIPPYSLRKFMTRNRDKLTTVGTIIRKQGVKFKNGDEKFKKIISRMKNQVIPLAKVEHLTKKGLLTYYIVPTEYTEEVIDIARQELGIPIRNRKERLTWVIEALKQRREFLTSFFNKDFDVKKPSQLRNDSWERGLEIVRKINFSNDTEADLARENGITRKAIDQTYRRIMMYLYDNAPENIRSKYQREYAASARKPVSISKRRKMSVTFNGSAVAVERAIKQGATSKGEIREITGISGYQLNSAIETARRWGADISKKPISADIWIRKLSQTKNNDEKRQRILNKLTYNSLRGLVRLYPDTFTNIRRVLSNGGFRVKSGSDTFKYIQSLIKTSGIPMRQVPNINRGEIIAYYSILLRQDEERLAILLDNDPRLGKFKQRSVGSFSNFPN